MNDTNCDAFMFAYLVNTTAIRLMDNSLISRITDFPAVINGVVTSADYLSIYTTKYSDSSYIMTVNLTAIVPDN